VCGAGDATPGPFVRIVAEAGGRGVGEDVRDRALEVRFVLEHACVEAGAEEVAVAAVAAVEALRVDAVQPLDAVGQVGAGGIDDEVVVRAHEAEGVAAPAVALDRLGQELEEQDAVVVVAEQELREHRMGGDVEVPVGQQGAEHARHRPPRVGPERRRQSPC
jgi:hypothetical protein